MLSPSTILPTSDDLSLSLDPEPLKYLGVSGGGGRGVILPGAIRALEETGHLKTVEKVGGVSAGAIYAFYIALGMSADDIQNEVNQTNLEDFKDIAIHSLSDVRNIFKKRGLYKGKRFLYYLRDVAAKQVLQRIAEFEENLKLDAQKLPAALMNLKRKAEAYQTIREMMAGNPKPNAKTLFLLKRHLKTKLINFNDLATLRNYFLNRGEYANHFAMHANKVKDLEILSTEIETKQIKRHSSHHHAEVDLASAVRYSMSIPLVYQRKKGHIDAGVIINNPHAHLIDSKVKNSPLIHLNKRKVNQSLSISFGQYKTTTGFFTTLLNYFYEWACNKIALAKHYEELNHFLTHGVASRVIELPTSIGMLDFKFTSAEKQAAQAQAKKDTDTQLAAKMQPETLTGNLLEILFKMPATQSESNAKKLSALIRTFPEESRMQAQQLAQHIQSARAHEPHLLKEIKHIIQKLNTLFQKLSTETLYRAAEEFSDKFKETFQSLREILNKLTLQNISDEYFKAGKHIIYERIKQTVGSHFNEFMQHLNKLSTFSSFVNDDNLLPYNDPHRDFFIDAQVEQLKLDAIAYLLELKTRPFQSEKNVTSLTTYIQQLQKTSDTLEISNILRTVQKQYQPRYTFFFSTPETNKKIEQFIRKLDLLTMAHERTQSNLSQVQEYMPIVMRGRGY